MASMTEQDLNTVKGLLHYLNDSFDPDGAYDCTVEVRRSNPGAETNPAIAVIAVNGDTNEHEVTFL